MVLVTAANENQAKAIAIRLVEAKLAACVSLIAPILSIYRWDKKICNEPETLLLVKTRRHLFKAVEAMVKRLHSYENPEVVALPMVAGSREYLKWLRDSTHK